MKTKSKFLYYLIFAALSLTQIVVTLLICTTAVLPIVMALTRHGFVWLCLYLLLPVWIALYIKLDNVIEDM
jgi:hypothetical protein